MSYAILFAEYVCIRCGETVAPSEVDCTAAPDSGPHEGVAPTRMWPIGATAHVAACPRATPWIVGNEIVDAACTCPRRSGSPTTDEGPVTP